MSITFAVDDVEAVRAAPAQTSLRDAASRALSTEVHVVSHNAALVEDLPLSPRPRRTNQLVACVHRAFAEHRPLTLSPDHVWLAISQGFAIHVDTHAEQLRERLVRHQHRVSLTQQTLAEPRNVSEWEELVAGWSKLIGEHVGPGMVRLLDCDFSTTTSIERTAGRVVAMSAFKKYFTYEIVCICGIPQVTLEGSVEDWKSLRQRLDVLEEYDLAWWMRVVRPVADQLVATAEGRPDRDFWRSIYKPIEGYGGATATGWLMRLFPYLEETLGGFVRNPAAQKPKNAGVRENQWVGPAISPSTIPAGLNFAPVTMSVREQKRSLMLFSGFLGYRHLSDGALRPEVAWGVGEPAPFTRALDEILSSPDCSATPPVKDRAVSWPIDASIPAGLIELYERADGFSFCDFTVFSASQLRQVLHREDAKGIVVNNTYGLTFGSLAGRPVSVVRGAKRSLPIVFFDGDASAWEPEDIPVVADSFEEFLVKVASGQPFEPIGTLYDRLPESSHVLRRALRQCEGAPLRDLSTRERHTLVMELNWKNGTEAQQAFWWRSLRSTLKLEQPKDFYFQGRRSPIDIFELMGDTE